MFELAFDPADAAPRLATVTVNRLDDKVNALAPDAIEQAEGMWDAIDGEPSVAGVVLVSAKPDVFIAGADVEMFAKTTDRRDFEALLRRAHAMFSRMSRSPKPIVAAIHGACLGAGLELTLVCTYRICTDSPKTILGVPEVRIGLFPGAGGATRLPRLVGLREALDMILTGRNIRPRAAKRMGLVDRVVAPEALMAAARDAASKLAAGRLQPRRGPDADLVRTALERNPLGRAVVLRQARRTVERKTYGLYPAPFVALDVIERGLKKSVDDSLRLEPPALAELVVGDVSRSLVYLFQASNALKRQTIAARGGKTARPRALDRLGLLGGGFMGADIAIVAAEGGIQTRIREISKEPLAKALAHVDGYFRKRSKRIGPQHVFKSRRRISGALDLEGYETMDLIIEAVPEDLALKQQVFGELEAIVDNSTILASNTSALPIEEIGAKLARPERMVGLHFFSPVPKMPLLEVVRTKATSPKTLATCIEFASRIGKTPIVVNDSPGFYTTRVLGFYLQAALQMVQDGHSIEDVDRGARKAGWPVGPLTLLDEVGIDVGAKVSKTLASYFPDRIEVSQSVDAFLAHKRFGRKSNRGFYVYPKRGKKHPDPEVYRFFPGRPASASRRNPDELGERITLVAALEAVRCLEQGVIETTRDGDIGAVFGFGYPPLRGGPFRHLGTRGLDTVLARLESFRERFGTVYDPPALLVDLARKGKDFTALENPRAT